MRAVIRIKRRNQRIRYRLERAVGEREDEHPPIKQPISRQLRLTCCGAKGHKSREHVQRKCGNDELAIAHLVADYSAKDDAEAKA